MFKKHIALPQDHGSWVFLLSPLLIGLFVAGRFTNASLALSLGALMAFLLRQPLSVAVKVWGKRRPASDLPPSLFWAALYGGILLLSAVWLVWLGHARLLWLGVVAAPVFAWHLWLIRQRQERHQMGAQIVASGVLALAAPAAYWGGGEGYAPQGWLLWLLCWLQAAASIVYAYLRLEQRSWPAVHATMVDRLRPAWRALLYATFNLGLTLLLGWVGVISPWVWLAYALQWGEVLYGALRPAVAVRPTQIGLRQLLISTLFTALFIAFW